MYLFDGIIQYYKYGTSECRLDANRSQNKMNYNTSVYPNM